MTTANTTLGARASGQSRAIPLGLAAVLGLAIVWIVGFSHVEAAHNAAHDYRHSMAFPCH